VLFDWKHSPLTTVQADTNDSLFNGGWSGDAPSGCAPSNPALHLNAAVAAVVKVQVGVV